MSDVKSNGETREEVDSKERYLKDFLSIKDIEDKVLYTCTKDELEKVLTDIITTGKYVKTFSPFGKILSITFESVIEKDRVNAYNLVRKFAKENEDVSRLVMDSYSNKVNIALQLSRIEINGNVTPLSQADLTERITFLEELPEETVKTLGKYLFVFANITSKAFNSEELIKN